jgi:hypothetical protein
MKATQVEYQALQSQHTFKEVPKAGITAKIIPLTWVFNYKLDSDGYLQLRYLQTDSSRRCLARGTRPSFNSLDWWTSPNVT